jgi:imidazolonepropionase-like amidohydrolase
VKEMREAGVTILPATDTAVVYIFPGLALQEEIALYVDLLDFSPLEAIEAATRQAAEFMGIDATIGTVEAGKVADLLILDANPLAGIRITQQIHTVILRGSVYDGDRLIKILECVNAEPDIHEDDWGRYP